MADLDLDKTDSSSSAPAAPARLRARIMASGYKYQMLGEQESLDLDFDEDRQHTDRTTWLKRYLVLLGLMAVALLVALVFVVARKSNVGPPPSVIQACETPECVETSATILSRMDQTASPCQDMFHLACGKWVKDAVRPPGMARWNMFSAVDEGNLIRLRQLVEEEGSMFKGQNSTAIAKMKTYYQSCMDIDTLEAQGTTELQEVMSDLGYWTVSPPPEGQRVWDEDKWSLQDSLVKFFKLHAAGLIAFYVDKDPNKEDTNVLKFYQADLTLDYIDGYKDKTGKMKEGFLNYATKVGVLLGGSESDVRAKVEDVYEFEKNLSLICARYEEYSDPRKSNNKYNLSDFQTLLGDWVNIKDYLQDIFDGTEFKDNTQVSVATPGYFSKLGEVISAASTETVSNYMMWRFLSSKVNYLPEAFMRAQLELSKVQSGTTSLLDRWKECLLQTKKAVGFASSALYVDKYFSSSSKTQVEQALDHVRLEFINQLDSVKWLDQATRAQLKDKAQAVSLMVGYPDWILEVDKLDHRYEKLEVLDAHLFTNRLNYIAYDVNRTLHQYKMKPEPNVWHMYPDEVNAYYTPNYNQIVVPAGILQPPFYSSGYPDALLYGTIGVVIGHELTHGFDNKGRLYDKHGRLHEQWTSAAEKGFNTAASCIADQYSAYSTQGHQLDGNLTLAENIADNGGLKLAYRAFQARGQPTKTRLPGLNFTDDQLFYLGFSQLWCSIITPESEINQIQTNTHSLPQFRVKGSLSNSREFSSAFDCPVDSPLNPVSKCEVW